MIHVDYVWVDGLASPLVRSKTKIVKPVVGDDGDFELSVLEWNFDGSSTNQATRLPLKILRGFCSHKEYISSLINITLFCVRCAYLMKRELRIHQTTGLN